MGRKLILIGIAVIPFVAGALLGYGIGYSSHDREVMLPLNADEEARTAEPAQMVFQTSARDTVTDAISSSRQNAITRTISLASPAVVGINVIEVRQYRYRSPWGDDPFFRQFFPDRTYSQQVQGLGSGFIISPDGYILTNDHVAGNAKEITVTLTNGEKYKAELIGSDQISDIALMKIDGKNLPYLKLGNSDDVIIGEWVIAFGNPFGLFDISDKPTITVGVVSATNMNLRSQEGRVYRGMIQTDAAINSGNSGGPLLNSVAEVIGINSVIYSPDRGNIGLGFAIPINRVKSIVADLKRWGKVEREFWTGLEVQRVDQRIARYFGLEKAEGVIVNNVHRSSPADRAGFRPGDIIMNINGEKVLDENMMISIVEDSRLGDVLRLRVLRERQLVDLNLKLEKRPT